MVRTLSGAQEKIVRVFPSQINCSGNMLMVISTESLDKPELFILINLSEVDSMYFSHKGSSWLARITNTACVTKWNFVVLNRSELLFWLLAGKKPRGVFYFAEIHGKNPLCELFFFFPKSNFESNANFCPLFLLTSNSCVSWHFKLSVTYDLTKDVTTANQSITCHQNAVNHMTLWLVLLHY